MQYALHVDRRLLIFLKDKAISVKETKRFLFILQLVQLGVTEEYAGTSPYAKILGPEQKKEWVAHRAFVALFVASHRGHLNTVNFLLSHGKLLDRIIPWLYLHSIPPSCLPSYRILPESPHNFCI